MASSKKVAKKSKAQKKSAKRKKRAGDFGRSKTPPTSVRFSPEETKQIESYKKKGMTSETVTRISKKMRSTRKFASAAALIRASLGFE